MMSFGVRQISRNHHSQWDLDEIMYKCVVSTVPADGPSLLGVRRSVGTVMANFASRIYTWATSEGLYDYLQGNCYVRIEFHTKRPIIVSNQIWFGIPEQYWKLTSTNDCVSNHIHVAWKRCLYSALYIQDMSSFLDVEWLASLITFQVR